MKNLKLILKSLISNDTCIEGGRNKPWYYAVVMFVVSIILSLVPTFVTNMKVNATDTFASTYHSLDNSIYLFSKSVTENNLDMTIGCTNSSNGKKIIHMMQVNKEAPEFDLVFNNVEGETKFFEHKHEEKINLRVYYLDEYSFSNSYEDNLYALLGYNKDDKTYSTLYTTIVFARDQFVVRIYDVPASTDVGVLFGDYEKIEEGFNFKSVYSQEDKIEATREKTWQNFANFLDLSYKRARNRAAWTWVGILSAINVLITLFMGLMIFILTRGKNNPFRIYTFWESQKIAYWSTLACGILCLALGFFLTNFAKLIFPLLLSLRVMWLSMKSLRPEIPAQK